MKMAWRDRWPVLAILLAGTGLRAFRLGAGSLWYDETVSVYLAGSRAGELVRHTAGDIHPPGYYLALRAWLIAAGYPTGHADAHGQGLEFAAGLFSVFFGILVIALAWWLAGRLAGRRVAVMAAALVAVSPYNVWYGQEVRMYTLAAALALLAAGALWQATAGHGPRQDFAPTVHWRWWALYALSAAAGLYTVYYFAFLLVPLNLWALAQLLMEPACPTADGVARRDPRPVAAWAAANLAVLFIYLPWIPVAWRQATQPPVPPWRAATGLAAALRESWTALSLGQSAPAGLWPAVLLLLPIYLLGLYVLGRQAGRHGGLARPAARTAALVSPAALLCLGTFGSLGLVLAMSRVTPLYHVRYVYTYSPFFYMVLAAGIVWLWRRWRAVATVAGALWLAAAGVTLFSFWNDPSYRPDDHRAAVAYLQSQWRPGDVVLVNAGYAYTALATYWQGSEGNPAGVAAERERLTGDLPRPDAGDRLLMVTTGHVDGGASLGWGDPRSDFFGMPAGAARAGLTGLFERFPRVWQYRIYDTVNDPQGVLRGWLAGDGALCEDRVFPGEASLRVQGYLPIAGQPAQPGWFSTEAAGLRLQAAPLPAAAAAGETLYPAIQWLAREPLTRTLATSIRLVSAADGSTWSQPPDVRPFGAACPAPRWPTGVWQRQTFALPVPEGTPPGKYRVQLVAYDGDTGQSWGSWQGAAAGQDGLFLPGEIEVQRPAQLPPLRPARAEFGPLALLDASSAATAVSPGDPIPVELTWQATAAPGEPLVVVLQLLDAGGHVVANHEAQPTGGRYPTQVWAAHEIVAGRETLDVPTGLASGSYRLVVGVYRASDRSRFATRSGLWGSAGAYTIKTIEVK